MFTFIQLKTVGKDPLEEFSKPLLDFDLFVELFFP